MNMNTPELSKCHKAPVTIAGGMGDFRDDDLPVTMHYECTECSEACDLYTPEPSEQEG